MHNAECYIRQEISKVSTLGTPIRSIKDDIKLAYFHGYIDINTYQSLNAELIISEKTFESARNKRHDEFQKKQQIALDNYRNRQNNT